MTQDTLLAIDVRAFRSCERQKALTCSNEFWERDAQCEGEIVMGRLNKVKTALGVGLLAVTLVGSLVGIPGAAQAQGHHGGHGGGHWFAGGHGGGHGFYDGNGGGHRYYGGHGRSYGYGGFGHGHRYYSGRGNRRGHGHYGHRRGYYGVPVAAGLIGGGLPLNGLVTHSPYYGGYAPGYDYHYGY
jgi:hypothetical protein